MIDPPSRIFLPAETLTTPTLTVLPALWRDRAGTNITAGLVAVLFGAGGVAIYAAPSLVALMVAAVATDVAAPDFQRPRITKKVPSQIIGLLGGTLMYYLFTVMGMGAGLRATIGEVPFLIPDGRYFGGIIAVTSLQGFGEMALLDREVRSATVLADDELVCLSLSRSQFDALALEHPGLALKLLANLGRELSQRIRLLNQRLVSQ